MQYYKHLYVHKTMEKKKDKTIRKLEEGKYRPAVHLIILPEGEGDQLEIIDTSMLRQKGFPRRDFFVVGIAKDQGDALKMVAEIVEEVYNETGGTDVRSYILEKEQEDV